MERYGYVTGIYRRLSSLFDSVTDASYASNRQFFNYTVNYTGNSINLMM